jgi:hypothetical protein
MNISGIILVLVAAFCIYKIQTGDQTGGDLQQMTIDNRYQDPYYAQQYRELDDVDNVLNRSQEPGNKVIQDLVAWNVHDDGLGGGKEQELREPIKKYLDFMDIKTLETSEETKVLVESKQPYFLDEAMIIDSYGHKFYWDWRYPKQPISIDFATDPDAFVRSHPNEYPSYIIKSRDYSELRPNNDDTSSRKQ